MAPPKETTTSTSTPKKQHSNLSVVMVHKETLGASVRAESKKFSKGLCTTKEAINKVGPPTEGSEVSAHGARNSIKSNSRRRHVGCSVESEVCGS
jgi:hypothetical protein